MFVPFFFLQGVKEDKSALAEAMKQLQRENAVLESKIKVAAQELLEER